MITSRALLAVALGFGFAQVGCMVEGGDAEVEAIDDVGYQALAGGDPAGGGGTNGLNDFSWDVSYMNLWDGTFGPFDNTNPSLVQLAGNSHGIATLGYAAKCALPQGVHVVGEFVFPTSTPAILNTTSGWATGGLGTLMAPQPKYDLFECMIAHLNPWGNYVPIRLTGASVSNSLPSVESLSYNFKEALWVAHQNPAGALVLEAWPLENLRSVCGTNTSSALFQRACGSVRGRCGITIREDVDVETACTQDEDGNWSCEGHPAIQTWLKADDWLALYSSCAPNPG